MRGDCSSRELRKVAEKTEPRKRVENGPRALLGLLASEPALAHSRKWLRPSPASRRGVDPHRLGVGESSEQSVVLEAYLRHGKQRTATTPLDGGCRRALARRGEIDPDRAHPLGGSGPVLGLDVADLAPALDGVAALGAVALGPGRLLGHGLGASGHHTEG
jgi:hypothetical protein